MSHTRRQVPVVELRYFDITTWQHQDAAIVHYRTATTIRVRDEVLTLPVIRSSSVLTKRDGGWRFSSLHSSFPMAEQAAGQSWPSVVELCEKNRLLERQVAQRTAELARERERERSDSLLRNILPAPIAERLKHGPQVIADRFETATVLFADIVGFTAWSARTPPLEVVSVLDRLFAAIDALVARHGVEKIKTIGDAYMAAAGIPEPRPDHVNVIARLALDIRAQVEELSNPDMPLGVRIGIHTGPLVAGVIGRRKFTYDLWGDTVNVASRLESHGEPGRIQISAPVRAGLGPAFRVSPRGPIELKGRGTVETFWLEEEASTGS